jgi:hypothetical protein
MQQKGSVEVTAALLPEAKHQPRPSDPVLAHLRAGDREQAAPHTHRAPRAEHARNSQGLPRRADAISKAGVRRPDIGRVVCHDQDRRSRGHSERQRERRRSALRRHHGDSEGRRLVPPFGDEHVSDEAGPHNRIRQRRAVAAGLRLGDGPLVSSSPALTIGSPRMRLPSSPLLAPSEGRRRDRERRDAAAARTDAGVDVRGLLLNA